MQFRKPFKQAIARGDVDLTFRVWKTPRAKQGSRYNIPPFGSLEVLSVTKVVASSLTKQDVLRSGFTSMQMLLGQLKVEASDPIWRIEFRYLGEELVNQPTRTRLGDKELGEVLSRLEKWDAKGAWTCKTLALVDANPGCRAGDLSVYLELDTPRFKRKVRQLKGLGLTESLEVGYRLSERGKQVLSALT
ncbi:MAG: hypothetical protein AAF541_03040 [Pseudomonadota bacterium]